MYDVVWIVIEPSNISYVQLSSFFFCPRIKQVTSVIATVEDSLGVPSPEELAVNKEEALKQDEETRRLAEGGHH